LEEKSGIGGKSCAPDAAIALNRQL